MSFAFYHTVLLYSKLILPWFLVGILLAFLAEKLIHPSFIKKFTGKLNFFGIAAISLAGMISPLSIMSFLPVAREFAQLGVPATVLFSFFIAERSYDLQSFFMITGLFNLEISVIVAFIIFLSLVVTIYGLKDEKVDFTKKSKKENSSFWERQLKTFIIVIFGIVLGAILRTYIPEQFFVRIAGSEIGGVITALVIGFSVYLGPILGNYPVVKAFSELGMNTAGVLTFLTVSPILNFIIIILFSSSVGVKITLKAAFIYCVTALTLTLLVSAFIKF